MGEYRERETEAELAAAHGSTQGGHRGVMSQFSDSVFQQTCHYCLLYINGMHGSYITFTGECNYWKHPLEDSRHLQNSQADWRAQCFSWEDEAANGLAGLQRT